MCVKRSFGMTGSDGLHLKIAPLNMPVTRSVCVCMSSRVCLCVIVRLSAPVYKYTSGCLYLCVCVQVFLAALNLVLSCYLTLL